MFPELKVKVDYIDYIFRALMRSSVLFSEDIHMRTSILNILINISYII